MKIFFEEKEAIEAYFSARFVVENIELRFLYLAQSAEALCRRVAVDLYPQKAESRRLRNILEAAFKREATEEFRERYGERYLSGLRGLSRPSFRELLTHVADKRNETISQFVDAEADAISRIVYWRNNITHRNSIQDSLPRKSEELAKLSDILQVLVEAMLLDFCLVPQDFQVEALSGGWATKQEITQSTMYED